MASGGMTAESFESNGGYSVYFNSSFTEWWIDKESKTIRDWTEEMTSGKIKLFTKPEDRIQWDNRRKSLTRTIRSRLKDKSKEEPERRESDSQSKVQAVLVIIPVHENIINVAEYLRKCIPYFCEEYVTATNGTEVICFADVKEMSLECLTELVKDLYSALRNYDVSITTGVKPTKGPITCLCLHVTI